MANDLSDERSGQTWFSRTNLGIVAYVLPVTFCEFVGFRNTWDNLNASTLAGGFVVLALAGAIAGAIIAEKHPVAGLLGGLVAGPVTFAAIAAFTWVGVQHPLADKIANWVGERGASFGRLLIALLSTMLGLVPGYVVYYFYSAGRKDTGGQEKVAGTDSCIRK
jgi:hypothetical protein